MVVKQVEDFEVNNEEVCGTEDKQVDSLESTDHHLVHGAADQDQQHAVGEVLGEVGGGLAISTGSCAIILSTIHNIHPGQHLCGSHVNLIPENKEWIKIHKFLHGLL